MSDGGRASASGAGAGAEYVLSPDVIIFPVDDGSVRLLDLDGAFCALPQIGAEMLRGTLDEGTGPTLRRISETYRTDPERVRLDFETLLAKLEKNRLIRKGNDRSRARWWGRWVATMLIRPTLWFLGLFRSHEHFTTVALLLLARCCFALFGWARTVAAWQTSVWQPRSPVPADGSDDIIARIDDTVRQRAAHLPLTDCKERALCCWFLLCSTGIPSVLVVGIQVYPLTGHCWCQVGARVLTDFSDRCDDYTPVIRYEAA